MSVATVQRNLSFWELATFSFENDTFQSNQHFSEATILGNTEIESRPNQRTPALGEKKAMGYLPSRRSQFTLPGTPPHVHMHWHATEFGVYFRHREPQHCAASICRSPWKRTIQFQSHHRFPPPKKTTTRGLKQNLQQLEGGSSFLLKTNRSHSQGAGSYASTKRPEKLQAPAAWLQCAPTLSRKEPHLAT